MKDTDAAPALGGILDEFLEMVMASDTLPIGVHINAHGDVGRHHDDVVEGH